MTIRGNLQLGTVDIGTTDTVLIQTLAPLTRQAITAFTLHETAAAAVSVSFYSSPDLTSASGDRIAVIALAADETLIVSELIDQSFPVGFNLIAVADVVGSNCTITVAEYDGDS